MPIVSVVVASYNRPKMLKETLDRLIAMKDSAKDSGVYIDIVVSDNGSDSETIALIDSYNNLEDSIVTFTGTERPYNTPAALYNAGAMFNAGDALLFLDDDNIIQEGMFEYVARMLDGGYGAAVCGSVHFAGSYDKPEYSRMLPVPDISDFPKADLSNYDAVAIEAVHPNCIIVSKALYESVGGFDEMLPSSIGIDYLIRILRAGQRVLANPNPLVAFRVHEGQRSQHPEYTRVDEQECRPYIQRKRDYMKKKYEVAIVGRDDPYSVEQALKQIPWISVKRFINQPGWVMWNKIRDAKMNLVIHTNLISADEPERKLMGSVQLPTLGVAKTMDGGTWIVPGKKMPEVLRYYPEVNWYVTDHEDAVGARERVILADPPEQDFVVEYWKDIINTVRTNHYIG